MTMKKFMLAFAFPAFLSAATVFSASGERVNVKKLVKSMTLERKVGQLFMVGGLGKGLGAEENFSRYHFGGVFLGSRDIGKLDAQEITRLNAELQALAMKHNGLPLMIATDQEGGRVNRVKKGVEPFPDQETAASNLTVEEAEKKAERVARQLRALGINTNFSPVVDTNTNRQSHIAVNRRSFSADPDTVARYASAYLKGYRRGNLIGCPKHFPGYGDVTPDPHKSLPSTGLTLKELEARELVPYRALIKEGLVDLIMTAHIMTPALENNDNLPATVSKEVMQNLLRKKMKYKGVLITDDFNMGAMGGKMPMEELAVLCVNAGVDIILFVDRPEKQRRAWQGVLAAAKDGRISEKRLNEAVTRVLELKQKYGILKDSR